ncbi:ATP-binding protein [Xylanimonas sp. McL0601]|uniref:ATP-binding protein n=1 Tax=Xylanimonas sp. McL0601 TaxID=3414739 RepID=UPI003CF4AC6A
MDGRSFEFQSSLHGLTLQAGGYVILDDGQGERFGQVLKVEAVSERAAVHNVPGLASDVLIRLAHGEGIVLDRDQRPFHQAQVRPATDEEAGAWFARQRPHRAALTVGELLLAHGVPANLDAGGFNRHTFMCGQSGSGKTYSLGVVLEQLILKTKLRLVILDPNSDYVHLADSRPALDADTGAAYRDAAAKVQVWGHESDPPLRLRFMDLDPAAQAAILGLDPLADRFEYAALMDLLRHPGERGEIGTGIHELAQSEDPEARALGLRAANLGVLDWSVWSRGQSRSLTDAVLDDSIRALVVDLGSLGTAEEQRLIAQATLSTLWRHRHRREPVLVVIDEAHNVCPREPADAVTRLAANTAALIAAEGRKFGLYLLVSTQRPQKVNEEVLTQCDNLLLMRMNSESDLAYLREVFSFVPQGLIHRATAFDQGQSLAGGKFFPQPGFIRFGRRLSEEGGADIATEWAGSA